MSDATFAMPSPMPNPLAILKPEPIERLYTLEEFLKKEAKSIYKHEFYNGKIIPMSRAKAPHNAISGNVITALNNAIDKANKNYVVLASDQLVYFPKFNFGVYPNALVVCEHLEFYDKNQVMLTNPILLVEVLSKSTRKFDQNGKFDLYKTLPSFREYVLVEQNGVSVETRFRVEPNLWREQTETNQAAMVRLDSLGLEIAVRDIYKRVPGMAGYTIPPAT
ncbi:MAG: Uma2 family endonuclease [Saprospiraceae bacterium]